MTNLLYNPEDESAIPTCLFTNHLAALKDADFIKEAEHNIRLAICAGKDPRAYHSWQATACQQEAERRGKPELYRIAGDNVSRGDKSDFINRLKILISLDSDKLIQAGIIPNNTAIWKVFQQDPFRWLIRADDDQAERIWKLIEKRSQRK